MPIVQTECRHILTSIAVLGQRLDLSNESRVYQIVDLVPVLPDHHL